MLTQRVVNPGWPKSLLPIRDRRGSAPSPWLTKGKDGVPAVQVAVPEGQHLAAPAGQDGGEDGVLEHEVDGVDEVLGLGGDLLLQAPNAGLEKDIGDPCGGQAASRALRGWGERSGAEAPLPSRAKRCQQVGQAFQSALGKREVSIGCFIKVTPFTFSSLFFHSFCLYWRLQTSADKCVATLLITFVGCAGRRVG